jgi:hypothetical protein
MTNEPIYCAICGIEDWNCEHQPCVPEYNEHPNYCELCGHPFDNCACPIMPFEEIN